MYYNKNSVYSFDSVSHQFMEQVMETSDLHRPETDLRLDWRGFESEGG